MDLTEEEIAKLPIATQAEWLQFLMNDGAYTAPEFLEYKFMLKTLKRPPIKEEE